MKVSVKTADVRQVAADATVVAVPEGTAKLGGLLKTLDAHAKGAIARVISTGEFKGKQGMTALVHVFGERGPKRVILSGIGKPDEPTAVSFRRAVAAALGKARAASCKTVSVAIEDGLAKRVGRAALARAAVEGAVLGLYRFDSYRTDRGDVPAQVAELVLIARDETAARELKAGGSRGEALARNVAFARDLANMPPNDLTPLKFAQVAAGEARRRGVTAVVFDEKRLAKEGFRALLSVGKGSANPPRLVVLDYRGGTGAPVVLVGKGVTFDSGGISLKPGEGMGAMKGDMHGAASVLGAFLTAVDWKLKRRVACVLPMAENMPSGTASRPADVVRAYDGTTIEIISTDAEGRMLLADAIAYSVKNLKPSAVVDMATLTGACAIALGAHHAGLFTPDDGLAEALLTTGKKVGEPVWRMPLGGGYARQLKSDVADVKHTGGRNGGACAAATFLSRFAGQVPWAHVDIAGVAAAEAENGADVPKGMSGYGVRLLAEWLAGD